MHFVIGDDWREIWPSVARLLPGEMRQICRASNACTQSWYLLAYLSRLFLDRRKKDVAGAYMIATFHSFQAV